MYPWYNRAVNSTERRGHGTSAPVPGDLRGALARFRTGNGAVADRPAAAPRARRGGERVQAPRPAAPTGERRARAGPTTPKPVFDTRPPHSSHDAERGTEVSRW